MKPNLYTPATPIASAALLAACLCVLGVAHLEASTNFISICLVSEPTNRELDGSPMLSRDTNHLLAPIFSDADFLAFDQTNHTFTVTAEAARHASKLLKRHRNPTVLSSGELGYDLCWDERDFVFLAFGQPVYSGVFSCPFSSVAHHGPVIWASVPFISAGSSNTVRFSIGLLKWRSDGEDVRSDRRILEAIKKLGL